MGLIEILLVGVALAMDAFAVSICKGLAMKRSGVKEMSIVGAWFGGFQGLMPLLGFLLGSSFAHLVEPIDHWVAFVLLALIGANMLREACSCGEEAADASLSPRTMLVMAIATSIDALAVGISFAMAQTNIWAAVLAIAVITFALSALGVKIGSVFGAKFQRKAEIFGGIVLILIGTKILFEHLGWLPV